MSTIIDALINFLKKPNVELHDDYVRGKNRANNMGEALEEYVKDLFAGTYCSTDSVKRLERFQEVFSYTGNQNNPPDFILKGGDAVEVKKEEGMSGSIPLNSSYPKRKLYSDSGMISTACRLCEEWEVKDMLYCIGTLGGGADRKNLTSLVFVYGDDYAADMEVYERIKSKVKEGVLATPEIEFQETKELGRVNRVDPLGITYLRIRGMWGIEHPLVVFDYVIPKRLRADTFTLIAIINKDKWETLPRRDELLELISFTEGATISEVQIKDPDNPVRLKEAYLIMYEQGEIEEVENE